MISCETGLYRILSAWASMHACHASPHIRRKHIFDWSIRLGIRLIYRVESSLKLCGIISRYRSHRTRIPMANDSEKEMAALASLAFPPRFNRAILPSNSAFHSRLSTNIRRST